MKKFHGLALDLNTPSIECPITEVHKESVWLLMGAWILLQQGPLCVYQGYFDQNILSVRIYPAALAQISDYILKIFFSFCTELYVAESTPIIPKPFT